MSCNLKQVPLSSPPNHIPRQLVTILHWACIVSPWGLCNKSSNPSIKQLQSGKTGFFKSTLYVFWSQSLTREGGGEAGISIETQVGAINLTAAILVLFPVNLKQMRVILAIIQRREETTNIMLIVSPHRLLNAVALKTIMTRTIIMIISFLMSSSA